MSPRPPGRGLFVTGTDTGVGKTMVSVALLRLAHRRGLTAHPLQACRDWVRPPSGRRSGALACRPAPGRRGRRRSLRLPVAGGAGPGRRRRRGAHRSPANRRPGERARREGRPPDRRGGRRPARPLCRRRDLRGHRRSAETPSARRGPNGARDRQSHRPHPEGGGARLARGRRRDPEPDDGNRGTARDRQRRPHRPADRPAAARDTAVATARIGPRSGRCRRRSGDAASASPRSRSFWARDRQTGANAGCERGAAGPAAVRRPRRGDLSDR